MNLRDLMNRLDKIETSLNEAVTMQDVQAAIAGKSNEQDRAKALMDLAASGGLPGLYDPVSGYFVSSQPDTSNWPEQKPRISSTGSEAINKQLAGLGLIPKNANQSTLGGLFGTGSFFGSSEENNKARQDNVTTSDRVIAKQTSDRVNSENLKKLNDIVTKLEQSIAASIDSKKGQNPNIDDATRKAALASVKEDIEIARQLIESFGYVSEMGAVGKAAVAAGAGAGIAAHNVLKAPPGEDEDWWDHEIISGIPYSPLDVAMDLGIVAAGFALGSVAGPPGEIAALASNASRIEKIAHVIKVTFAKLGTSVKGQEALKAIKTAVIAFKDNAKFSLIANTIINLLKDAHVIKESDSIAFLTARLQLIEHIAEIEENWLTDLGAGAYKLGKPLVTHAPREKVLQLTYDDLMTIDGKDLIREIPDTFRSKVVDWLKAHPGQTIGAAIVALGLSNMPIGGSTGDTPTTPGTTPLGQGGTAKKWPTTPEEIKAFQKGTKDPRTGGDLVVDGIIGSHTYQALIQQGYKPPSDFGVTPYKTNQKKPDDKKPEEKKPEEPASTTITPTPEQAEMIAQIKELQMQLSTVEDNPEIEQAVKHSQEVLDKFGDQK